jgi:hypothetical protein
MIPLFNKYKKAEGSKTETRNHKPLAFSLKPLAFSLIFMQKEKLYGKTLNELIAVTKRLGLPGFAARQIADWLYKKEISSIE